MAGKVKLTKCPQCCGGGEVMANTLPWRQREEGAFAACPYCKATGFTPLVRTQVHNKHHGTAPPGAIYIGRGSPWGNPFAIGKDGDRDQVCDRFEREVLPNLDITALAGKDLVCFCKPARCHGDSILRAIAAQTGSRETGE